MREAFELRDVRVERDGRPILHDVDLTLGDSRIAVIGLNGSGKSTLVRLLNGLIVPEQGSVVRAGLDTRTARDARALRRQVGFVFQNPDNQVVMPIVADDVAFGLKNLKVAKSEIPGRVAAGLDRFGLAGLGDRESATLSGGEKQLLALAAVLVMDPAVVIMDEPTTMLDLLNTRRLLEIVNSLDQQVIMVSHHLDLLSDWDRVVLVHEGRIAADGAPGEVVAHYRVLVERLARVSGRSASR